MTTLQNLIDENERVAGKPIWSSNLAILHALHPMLVRLEALGYKLKQDKFGLCLEAPNDLPWISLGTVSGTWEQRQKGNPVARVTWSAEANSCTGVYVSEDEVPAPKPVRGRKLTIESIEAFVKEVRAYMAAKMAFKKEADAKRAEDDKQRKAKADAWEAEKKRKSDGAQALGLKIAHATGTGLVSFGHTGFKLEIAPGLFVRADEKGALREVDTVDEKGVIHESPLTVQEVIVALRVAITG